MRKTIPGISRKRCIKYYGRTEKLFINGPYESEAMKQSKNFVETESYKEAVINFKEQ